MTKLNEEVLEVLNNLKEEDKNKVEVFLKWYTEEHGEEIEVLEESGHQDFLYTVDSEEYLIVNEDEKQAALIDEIQNSLWAFKPSFLAERTDWALFPVFEAIQKSGLYEDGNEAVLTLVEKYTDLNDFIESAVEADGAGHFLSPYDGEEIDFGNGFYAYKVN